MKKKIALFLALVMLLTVGVMGAASALGEEEPSAADKEAADKVAALIDAIYVQERTETTDADCAAAKAALRRRQGRLGRADRRAEGAGGGRGSRPRLLRPRHR